MASRKKNLNAQPVMNARVGRMTPVAVAVSVVLGGGHGVADAGVALRMAMPAIRPGSISTNFAAPVAGALPKPVKSLTDADGNAQNIASSGNTTGVQDDKQHLLTLSQGSAKAIVQFNSFDIGSSAAVNVYMNNGEGSSALYQVTNSTSPSQLYGALNAFTKGADGQYKTGGEILLINQNGILFGRGAQVNVGGLFGSALGVDEADFLSGFKNSILGAAPTFSGGATYAPETNFVKVETGANITTASGGRVFLLGGQVENAGNITTPNGQTVLAAGRDVYLSDPSNGSARLYMSEANVNVPTVKGLLVEVNSDAATLANEFATNSGGISTPTGNATIVGWAVNQRGRISATTSVTQNGSVYLLARSGTTPLSGGVGKHATKGGALTLDEGSSIDIKPDTTLDASGKVQTVTAASVFTPSRVELSGQTIEFKSNAQIVAPNATVNVRASSVPAYDSTLVLESGMLPEAADSKARIVMGAGSAIDVSGTIDTSVSVARNFVTTDLLGYQDLKDAPLQKEGPLYRSKLTLDIRQTSPILGDLQTYRDAVLKSADEFMSAGGKVTLASGVAVAMHPTARIDVSGGQVAYTDAPASVSVLVAEDGQRYTLNNAPSDVKYVAIAGKEASTTTRFGSTKAGSANPVGKNEPGYIDGQAAGSVSVYAPVALLDGQLKGATVTGARQLAGTDAMAKAGTLNLGTATNVSVNVGSKAFADAVVNDVQITAAKQTQPDSFWANAVEGDLSTTTSRISAEQINASGFGNVVVTANHGIEQMAGANLNLVDHASVVLQTSAKPVSQSAPLTSDLAAGVVIAANTRSVGGSFKAAAYESVDPSSEQTRDYGAVQVKSGVSVDVSGNWVNQRLDGNTVAAASKGGSIALQSDHDLKVSEGVTLNVSGGVTVTKSSAFAGTKAGSITLEGLNRTVGGESVSIGHDLALKGYSLSQGGSVRIKSGDVSISDSYSGLSQGEGISSLNVGSDFFSQGGFLSYDIDGRNSLLIQSGAHIQPHAVVWQALASGRNAATGSDVAKYTQADLRSETVRKPVRLAFKSTGVDNAAGRLTMQRGAVVHPDALSSVSLTAANALDLAGQVVSRGGQITAVVQTSSDTPVGGSLTLRSGAVLDVSGGGVLTPNNSGLLLGDVVNGGAISVGVKNNLQRTDATLDIQSGAQLIADGGVASIDVARTAGSFGAAYSRQTLASDGGSINIQAGGGGANLSGSMSARAGNLTAQGGSLTVSIGTDTGGVINHTSGTGLNANTLHVQAEGGDGAVHSNSLTLSTKAVDAGGFDNLYVSSLEQVEFDGNVSLSLRGHLRIDAPVLQTTGENSRVFLKGGSTLQIGNSGIDTEPLSGVQVSQGGTTQLMASGGLIELFGQQATQGIDRLGLVSQTELRLRGKKDDLVVAQASGLDTQADVVINAQQVVPATATAYTLNAPDRTVTIVGGDVNAQTPLSGGASLTINAANINQNGVIKAPFGVINLNASNSLTLGAGSLTSVSGEDLLVPYGSTTSGGKKWNYGNSSVDTFQDKAITLNAAGQSVQVQSGSKLNLNGGGNLVGWEFVPGPGGSKDIFAGSRDGAFAIVPTIKGYAPYDSALLSAGGLSIDPAVGNALSLGNTLTFGTGGPIAAGTYAVLPARYALLPGAFLVKPAAAAKNVGVGYSKANPDGSYTVGAVTGVSGISAPGNVLPGAYTVMSSEVARRYSEISNTYADDFTAKQAALTGTAAPLQAADAGRLSVVADKLQLDGQIQFAHAAGKRGGQMDIAASKIHVGTDANAQADALNLTYDQLNKAGADSIVLGGVRQQSNPDGSVNLTVASQQVQVDASGDQFLSVGDLILASQDKVVLGDGAQIRAASNGSVGALLNVAGDGALLRVSGDASASSQRTGDTGAAGQLIMGNSLNLQGGAITAEATQSTQIANGMASATSFKADKLVLGASRIEVGGHDAASTDAPLVVSGPLLNQVSQVKDLTLRSFSSVDLYGTATLGGDKARNLTIDTANVRVADADVKVSLVAGGVNLLNTTKSTPGSADLGSSTLLIQATGQNGGTGHVTLGQGQVAVSGVQSTAVQAAGSVVMAGQGGLAVPGDLTVQAQSLTAQRAADGQLVAQGAFQLKGIEGAPVVAKAVAGAGANLSIAAQSVQQNGRIELPSGKLTITADQSVAFGGTSNTDLSGLAKTIDGQAIATMGGDLSVTAKNADIQLAQGGVLNVSAGLGASHAGSMTFSAVNGAVDLNGRLLATSSTGQKGGALKIDTQQAVDVSALANRIAAETSASVGNFTRSIELRNRVGDQTVQAGMTLSSQTLTITADSGSLHVAGALHANGDAGGQVNLAAGGDVVVAASADIQAKALSAGQAGGQVSINSASGQIQLQGCEIDTSGAGMGANGSLFLRALRTSDGVAIAPIDSTLTGVDSIDVEAVQQYAMTTVNNAQLNKIKADTLAYLGTLVEGVNGTETIYQNIHDTLSADHPELAGKLNVRAGVEIDSTGDMNLAYEKKFAQGLSLTEYTTNADLTSTPSDRGAFGQPTNWTFRSGGNLNVATNLSEGFSASGVAQQGLAGDVRLIGGADLSSANMMDVISSDAAGDVVVGDPTGKRTVSVRNTVGQIQIAAGRNVVLSNPRATVYTTGRPVLADEIMGYKRSASTPNGLIWKAATTDHLDESGNMVLDTSYTPFLTGGGNVSVQAAQDVVMPSSFAQSTTDWWYRWSNKNSTPANQLSWFNRYDLFQQGIATFGGGDVRVSAGRDASNVNASAAASGYTQGASSTQFGGGSTTVVAGRDVIGGTVMAAGNIEVVAGRGIKRPDSEVVPSNADEWPASLQLVYGQGNIDLLSRGDLTVGRLFKAGQLGPKKENTGTTANPSTVFYLYEPASDASLTMASTAGDVLIDGITPAKSSLASPITTSSQDASTLLDSASIAAANGSVTIGTDSDTVTPLYLMQDAGKHAALSVLAENSIHLNAALVQSDQSRTPSATMQSGIAIGESYGKALDYVTRNGGADRTAAQVVAEQGDITYRNPVLLTQSLRMIAGRDITAFDNTPAINIQHQTSNELSLIQAGRDINLPVASTGVPVGVNLGGPGDLVVASGRNLSLANSSGLVAVGNLRNANLPKGSANITVLTGVNFAKGDVMDAVNAFYPLLGGQGVGANPGLLYTQIMMQRAASAGQSATQAQADAQATLANNPNLLALARTLAGDDLYQQVAAGYVNHRVDGSVTGAAAAKQLETLSAQDQNRVAGQLLSKVWATVVPLDQRIKTAIDMAGGVNVDRINTLKNFVANSTAVSTEDVLTQFAKLPTEKQAILVTQLLSADVSAVIADAASKTGAARDAAYEPAYLAMNTVFPNVTDLPASLNMGASQIKTMQGSTARVFNPNGDVNVGQLTADSARDKGAADLGLVTAGGGDVSVLVRDNVAVNTSRIFTVVKGDEVIWSSLGNVDAGRGAKTVTSTPAPVFYLDANGQLQIDVTSAISGNGISATGLARIAAPKGEINAGDAGISATGGLDLAANVIRGADAIVSPVVHGAPPAPAVNMAVSAATPTQPTAAGPSDSKDQDDEAKKKKRKRSVLLDFLGFGSEDNR